MPKCDYCDVYLTHDSMSVRKAHNSGRNHLRNVVDYYQQVGHEKAQSVIDSITSSYAAEGQAHANPMLPHNQPGYAAAQARFGGGRPVFNGGGMPGGPRGMGAPGGIPPFGAGLPGAPGAPGVGGGPDSMPMPPHFNFPGGIPPPPGSAAFGGPGGPGGPGGRGFPLPPQPMFGTNGLPGAPLGAGGNMPPFPFPMSLPGQPGMPPPNFPGFPAGMPLPIPGQPGFPPIPPNFMQGAGGPPMPGLPGGDRHRR
ncbi:U1 small nuclear ribonucleoprotein C [Sporothrix epigloea]|uniref:U1 small nuclear ribonucleoprotein C n=1 Tax=Sporothrix epigloea TaxID=1892477 RepID=A0ABP0DFK6_9PEZI